MDESLSGPASVSNEKMPIVIKGSEFLHADGRTLFELLDPTSRVRVAFGGIGEGRLQAGRGVVTFRFPYRIDTAEWEDAFAREEVARREAFEASAARVRADIEEQQRRILPAHSSIDMTRQRWKGHGGNGGGP